MQAINIIVNGYEETTLIIKQVERTKLRPLASGELTYFQGLCCLGGMLSVSLGILLQLNWYRYVTLYLSIYNILQKKCHKNMRFISLMTMKLVKNIKKAHYLHEH